MHASASPILIKICAKELYIQQPNAAMHPWTYHRILPEKA